MPSLYDGLDKCGWCVLRALVEGVEGLGFDPGVDDGRITWDSPFDVLLQVRWDDEDDALLHWVMVHSRSHRQRWGTFRLRHDETVDEMMAILDTAVLALLEDDDDLLLEEEDRPYEDDGWEWNRYEADEEG